MRAFVVRPFGMREGINFDEVQRRLIDPALSMAAIGSSTTGAFLQAGNIRQDVFQGLLAADLVIADISVHNANVFYSLGVRHALQRNRTLLIGASQRGQEVPFDLRTDRYIEYNADRPEDRIEAMLEALRFTLLSDSVDSPIFQALPQLRSPDRSQLVAVPPLFREEVEVAKQRRRRGVLGLMASEVMTLSVPWATEGLRLVGLAQLNLLAFRAAKATFEALWKVAPADTETNQRLGTIYQRLGDLDASEQALQRVLSDPGAARQERAEGLSLMARNIKDRWRASWADSRGASAAERALSSPDLFRAFETYRRAFHQNLDSFYPGLNAMALVTIAIELAKKLPDHWESLHESEEQARIDLERLERQRERLSGAVGTSLDAAREQLRDRGAEDRWLDISEADYILLTSDKPRRVASAYRNALASAPEFFVDAARLLLDTFQVLEVLQQNAEAALSVFPPRSSSAAGSTPGPAVILFTGERVDPPGMSPPRFPDSIRERVRQAIADAVGRVRESSGGPTLGISSGAPGGDLLFQEVCEELGIDRQVYLPGPVDRFRGEQVSAAGRFWEEKFDALLRKEPPPEVLSELEALPLWLPAVPAYTPSLRAALWMVHVALALEPQRLTLLVLGDTEEHLFWPVRDAAEQYGATIVNISTSELLEANTASTA